MQQRSVLCWRVIRKVGVSVDLGSVDRGGGPFVASK